MQHVAIFSCISLCYYYISKQFIDLQPYVLIYHTSQYCCVCMYLYRASQKAKGTYTTYENATLLFVFNLQQDMQNS